MKPTNHNFQIGDVVFTKGSNGVITKRKVKSLLDEPTGYDLSGHYYGARESDMYSSYVEAKKNYTEPFNGNFTIIDRTIKDDKCH